MRPEHQEPRPRRAPRRWRPWALAAAIPVAGVAGGLIGAAIASPSSSAAEPSAGRASAGTAAACQVTQVAGKTLPSVVTISATGPEGAGGTGSGEVIRSDGGYILTNNHVIAGAVGGGSVTVLFSDGDEVPASIVGRDVLTDLAVLKVQAPARDLRAIPLGSSGSVDVGEPVVALGAPLGLSSTVTSGIVSAKDRTVEVPGEDNRSALLTSAVQTDAAINPGNSGGALVDCAGDLIGVPTAGATVPSPSGTSTGGSIGLGFAIPVDLAKAISDELIATGRATHSYFGLQTAPLSQEAAAQRSVSGGLFVAGVTAGGPAEKAGLRQGDIITAVNGEPATGNVQLQELTLTKNPGDTVQIEYLRGGDKSTATVTLAQQP